MAVAAEENAATRIILMRMSVYPIPSKFATPTQIDRTPSIG